MKHSHDFKSDILRVRHAPNSVSDRIALRVVKTVTAVPRMVGGLLQYLSALRHIRDDLGWIKELIDAVDNERMHLMTFIKIAELSWFERSLIMVAHAVFYNFYIRLYLLVPKTAHRVVGYLQEEAVVSNTHYLTDNNEGHVENVAAPQIAVKYWSRPFTAFAGRCPCAARRRGSSPRYQPSLCQSAGEGRARVSRRRFRSNKTAAQILGLPLCVSNVQNLHDLTARDGIFTATVGLRITPDITFSWSTPHHA